MGIVYFYQTLLWWSLIFVDQRYICLLFSFRNFYISIFLVSTHLRVSLLTSHMWTQWAYLLLSEVLTPTGKDWDLVFLFCFDSQGCGLAPDAISHKDRGISCKCVAICYDVTVSEPRAKWTLFSIIPSNKELRSDFSNVEFFISNLRKWHYWWSGLFRVLKLRITHEKRKTKYNFKIICLPSRKSYPR